jgi:hypothetical protein
VTAVINHPVAPSEPNARVLECDGFLGGGSHRGLVWRQLLVCWHRHAFVARRKGPMLVGPAASGRWGGPVRSAGVYGALGWARWSSLVAIGGRIHADKLAARRPERA